MFNRQCSGRYYDSLCIDKEEGQCNVVKCRTTMKVGVHDFVILWLYITDQISSTPTTQAIEVAALLVVSSSIAIVAKERLGVAVAYVGGRRSRR